MPDTTGLVRLTSLSRGAGCACKLSIDELSEILRGLPAPDHDALVVGHGTGDDAAVWRQADGGLLVATTDFFTPVVDDARDWGRIAATNAVSDVYAMGGTPMFALNILGWPRDLPFDILAEVLAGAQSVAASAGYVVAGGHSIDSAEPLFGQAVVGTVAKASLLTNAEARPGDVLILTKPIGTGIIMTAAKRSDGPASDVPGYADAVRSMTTLNADASRLAVAAGAHAATDVTGFGLIGHLHRMADASGVSATIDAASVPLLAGTRKLLATGHVPGGSIRNAEQATRYVVGQPPSEAAMLLLCDAQTSGGLLIALEAGRADGYLAAMAETGASAIPIGRIGPGAHGSIEVIGDLL